MRKISPLFSLIALFCLLGGANKDCPPRELGAGLPPTTMPTTRQAGAEQWGEADHGLAASLTAAAKSQFQTDEPVALRYRVKNVSSKPLTVWHCGFWPNHRLVVTDAEGHDVQMTDAGRTIAAAFAPNGERNKNVPFELAAGAEETQLDSLDLRLYFNLPVAVPLHVRCLYHDGDLQFWSNDLILRLRKAK